MVLFGYLVKDTKWVIGRFGGVIVSQDESTQITPYNLDARNASFST